MKQIANNDYATLLKLLPVLKGVKGTSLRDDNVLRQVRIILKKWSKKNSKEVTSSKRTMED